MLPWRETSFSQGRLYQCELDQSKYDAQSTLAVLETGRASDHLHFELIHISLLGKALQIVSFLQ